MWEKGTSPGTGTVKVRKNRRKRNLGRHPRGRSVEVSLQGGLGFGEKAVGKRAAQADELAPEKARGQKKRGKLIILTTLQTLDNCQGIPR